MSRNDDESTPEEEVIACASYLCTACGQRMKRWCDFEEHQHEGCGGLVVRKLAEVEYIDQRTDHVRSIERVLGRSLRGIETVRVGSLIELTPAHRDVAKALAKRQLVLAALYIRKVVHVGVAGVSRFIDDLLSDEDHAARASVAFEVPTIEDQWDHDPGDEDTKR